MSRLPLVRILSAFAILALPALSSAQGIGSGPPPTLSEQPIYDWKITVVKARNLKNVDWGKRKLSDPLVVIREYSIPKGTGVGAFSSRQAWDNIYDYVRWQLREDSHFESKVPGVGLLQGETKVVEDSLSPEWNYELETRRYSLEGLQVLIFLILDQDPMGRQNLGWAKLVRPAPGLHRLPLSRVVFQGQGAPGELLVEIERGVPEVTVPPLLGATPDEARRKLARIGLDFRGVPLFVPRTPKHGILRQEPTWDTRLKAGSAVTCVYEKGLSSVVPNLVGLTEAEARRKMRGLQLKVELNDGDPDDMDRWFKISEQSVEAGESIYRDRAVTATILCPPPGAEIQVPDLEGKSLHQARRILAARYLKLSGVEREEAPAEKAGQVLAQEPAAGTKIPYDGATGVKLTYGFFADGLSYDSAKKITLGETFECDLNRADMGQFRRVTVTEPGYLACRKASAWHLTTGCTFFAPEDAAAGSQYRRLDYAQRVTPGEWVLRFGIEYHMTPGVVKFQTVFVPEMDAAEPNDDFESASDISFPTRLTIGLCPPDDVDFYRFETEEAGYVTVATEPWKDAEDAKGRLEVRLQVFDADRQLFYEGSLRQMLWLPPGTWFLRLWSPSGALDTRPYPLSLDFAPDTDRTEPNNSIDTATVVHVPASKEVRYTAEDIDYYRLVADEPGWVVISHPRKIGSFTYVRPFGPDGKGGERYNLPCAVAVDPDRVVMLTTEEEYRSASSYEPVNLDLVFVPRTEDPFEPNDDPAAAPLVQVNKTHEALLLPARDHDCYRFELTEAGPVEAAIPRGYGGTFIGAQLFDTAGNPLEERPDYVPRKWDLEPGEYVVRYHQHSGDWVASLHPYAFLISAPNEPAMTPDPDRYDATGGEREAAREGLGLARRAYAHYVKNEFDKAAPLYEEASTLLTGCAALWNDFGSCCLRLGSMGDAKAHYLKAVEIDPGYALALRNLGVVERLQGDFAGYIEWTGKAVAADATAENLSYHGHALTLAGATEADPALRRALFKRAVDAFRKSLEMKKDPAVEQRLRIVEKRLEELEPK